ncbi:MAG: hypothetical protein AAFQ47_08535 [Pseudomonadota bacterium]
MTLTMQTGSYRKRRPAFLPDAALNMDQDAVTRYVVDLEIGDFTGA